MQYMNIEQSNKLLFKWKALISFLREKERKKTSEGKKKRKKNCAFATPETRTLALHAFPAFQYSIPTH